MSVVAKIKPGLTIVRRGWRSLLVSIALASWLAKLSLNYVSSAADWFWYLSLGCSIVLFSLSWIALFRRRWAELLIFTATLGAIQLPVFGVGDVLVENIQEKVFRTYILHRIGDPPFDKYLSGCKLVSYVEDDGSKHTIGQCDSNLHSTEWLFFSIIYDPTHQLDLPGYRRSTPWRMAVADSFRAPGLKSLDAEHLRGDFYYIKISNDQLGY